MLAQDTESEIQSLMAWLDRRLKHASAGTLRVYVKWFKQDWMRTFGTLDNIPQEYKDRVTALHQRLKVGEYIESRQGDGTP